MRVHFSLFYVLILFFMLSCSETQVINRMSKDKEGNFIMIGRQNIKAFQHEAYSNWYQEEYDSYQPNKAVLKKIKKKIKDYKIIFFYGSWCSDSRREVPRFLKIMDELYLQKNQVEIYAVNRDKESFYGEEQGKNILKVPTFIFYTKKNVLHSSNQNEVNRIIESPVGELLEEDILKIVNREVYTPNYYY